MTRLIAIARLLARDAFLVLATVAIALKIMIPAGFMPSQDQRNGLPFAMVLCTGQGAKVVESGQALGSSNSDHQEQKTSHDMPCPFAAQGATIPPPLVATAPPAQCVAYLEAVTPLPSAVSPGGGLAAPPPPPTGPPSLLI